MFSCVLAVSKSESELFVCVSGIRNEACLFDIGKSNAQLEIQFTITSLSLKIKKVACTL